MTYTPAGRTRSLNANAMLDALEAEARAAYHRYKVNREDSRLPREKRLDPQADEYTYWWKRRFQCLMRIRRAGR